MLHQIWRHVHLSCVIIVLYLVKPSVQIVSTSYKIRLTFFHEVMGIITCHNQATHFSDEGFAKGLVDAK
jgi:hypothetical protein